jgi:hypothetical protein
MHEKKKCQNTPDLANKAIAGDEVKDDCKERVRSDDAKPDKMLLLVLLLLLLFIMLLATVTMFVLFFDDDVGCWRKLRDTLSTIDRANLV